MSQSTSPSWGVVVSYDNGSWLWFNVGACVAQLGASDACVAAEEELEECELAACGGACQMTTDSDILNACFTSAQNGECATYQDAISASCPASILDAAACAPDVDGGTDAAAENEAYFMAYAAEACE